MLLTPLADICINKVSKTCVVELVTQIENGGRLSGVSRCFTDNEDTHEEDHDEKYPHEESVHHLGDLLPFGHFQARRLLLAEAVCDIFDIPDQLRVAPENSTVATTTAVNTAVKGQMEGSRFVIIRATRGRSSFEFLLEVLFVVLKEGLGIFRLSER